LGLPHDGPDRRRRAARQRPSPRPASWRGRSSRYQLPGLCPEEPRRGCAPDPRLRGRAATLRPWRGARRAGEREVESATGQLTGPSISPPITGALPRRAPPGLRPAPLRSTSGGAAACTRGLRSQAPFACLVARCSLRSPWCRDSEGGPQRCVRGVVPVVLASGRPSPRTATGRSELPATSHRGSAPKPRWPAARPRRAETPATLGGAGPASCSQGPRCQRRRPPRTSPRAQMRRRAYHTISVFNTRSMRPANGIPGGS